VLNEFRIPMNEQEEEAIARLLAKEAKASSSVSFSRNDPGESGPVRVEIDDRAWLVDEDGHYAKAAS
jgi:hypothetical protein